MTLSRMGVGTLPVYLVVGALSLFSIVLHLRFASAQGGSAPATMPTWLAPTSS